MQEAYSLALDEVSYPKLKKKPSAQPHSLFQVKEDERRQEISQSSPRAEKLSKRRRNLKNEPSPPFQHHDRSTPDSLPDSSLSNNEYRALRHKYLLLEEENCQLESELGEVEAEVKTLEDEKNALLDKLVVLEGLMDPSELQQQRGL